MPARKVIPADTLRVVRRRLDPLPPRAAERRVAVRHTAEMFGMSVASVDRALQAQSRPHTPRRADQGRPRALDARELEHDCAVIAAMKLRTRNRQGRHLSTVRAIELLERYGVETPDGHVQAPPGVLARGRRTAGCAHGDLTTSV